MKDIYFFRSSGAGYRMLCLTTCTLIAVLTGALAPKLTAAPSDDREPKEQQIHEESEAPTPLAVLIDEAKKNEARSLCFAPRKAIAAIRYPPFWQTLSFSPWNVDQPLADVLGGAPKYGSQTRSCRLYVKPFTVYL